jgi:peptide chain release factor 2
MGEQGFWDNQEAAKPVVAELKALKSILAPVADLTRRIEDASVLYELAQEEGSAEAFEEAAGQADSLTGEIERLELRTLLSGPRDAGGCYFSIHAGAGGTESCDWAEMLLRMYVRYFERGDYSAEEIDRVEGEEAGIRSVTLEVNGPYAYGYLSCERGVHRLVRISPYDAQNRRHTSFASVDVLPMLEDVEVEIDWD